MHDPIRSITLPTADHGPVTLEEPSWCRGHHSHTPDTHRVDIVHQGTTRILALPSRGRAVQLLTLTLEQRPFAAAWPGTAQFFSVGIDGDHYPMRRPALHAAADELMNHAAVLRMLADQLGTILAGEDR